MPSERDEKLLLDLPPNSVDAHLLGLLYRNPERVYTQKELIEELDASAAKATNALARLHDEHLIKKPSDGQYHGLNDRDDLKRFAANMGQLRSLFDRYSGEGSSRLVK